MPNQLISLCSTYAQEDSTLLSLVLISLATNSCSSLSVLTLLQCRAEFRMEFGGPWDDNRVHIEAAGRTGTSPLLPEAISNCAVFDFQYMHAEGETVADLVVELCWLTEYCEFGTTLDDMFARLHHLWHQRCHSAASVTRPYVQKGF